MISVKAELAAKNFKYLDAAKATGIPIQTFHKKLRTNRFTLDEAEKILALVEKKLVLLDNLPSHSP